MAGTCNQGIPPAEVPVNPKGKLIERKDVEESVYAQGIKEFNWPEHMDGPKFHTMVSFFQSFHTNSTQWSLSCFDTSHIPVSLTLCYQGWRKSAGVGGRTVQVAIQPFSLLTMAMAIMIVVAITMAMAKWQ